MEFVEPNEVKAMITGPDREKVLVVDVRDEDFEGGHIKGAVNLPSEQFIDEAIDEFIASELKAKETVVVHCMLSQIRGPRCARRLAERLAAASGAATKPQVVVMRNGYQGFSDLYGADPELVQKD